MLNWARVRPGRYESTSPQSHFQVVWQGHQWRLFRAGVEARYFPSFKTARDAMNRAEEIYKEEE